MLLPAIIQVIHAYEKHEHVICSSDVEHHFHEDDIECALCHLQADSYVFLDRNTYDTHIVQFSSEYQLKYIFFKSHQHLPFTLRGPPSF